MRRRAALPAISEERSFRRLRIWGIAFPKLLTDNNQGPGEMLMLIDEPELVVDLRDHLRMVGCIAARVGPDLLSVTVPDAPTDDQERRELRAYLATSTAARGVDTELVDD